MNVDGRGQDSAVVHVDDDLCIDLLDGLLPRQTRDQILDHLETCPECEELVRQRSAERARIQANAPETYRAAGTPQPEVRAVRSMPRWAPLAGLAAAAGVLAVFFITRPPAPIPEASWLPGGDGMVELRGGAGDQGDELSEGLRAYARRDLPGAIAHLRAARETGTYELARATYLGSALAAQGNYEEAVRVLGALPLDGIAEPWRSESRWAYFVALDGSKRNASADSLLRVLAAEPGDVGDRARAFRRRGR